MTKTAPFDNFGGGHLNYDNDALISEINSVDNLIALCPNHHWEYDNGLLSMDEYIL